MGFFYTPSSAYACGTKSSKHCCKMEVHSKEIKKDCCCKKSNSEKNKENSCDGKCKPSMCSVPSVNFGITPSANSEILISVFDFSTKKQKYNETVSRTSSGYCLLWLIPKIS